MSSPELMCLAKDIQPVDPNTKGLSEELKKIIDAQEGLFADNKNSPQAPFIQASFEEQLKAQRDGFNPNLATLSTDPLGDFIATNKLQTKEPPDQAPLVATAKTQTKISKPKVVAKHTSQKTGENSPVPTPVYLNQSPDHKTPQQLEQQAANEARTKQDALAQIAKIPGATKLKANLDKAVQNQQEAIANYNTLKDRLNQEFSVLSIKEIAASKKVLDLEGKAGSRIQATDFLSKMQLKILGRTNITDSPELAQARNELAMASKATQAKYEENNAITDKNAEYITKANRAVELAETRYNDKINNTPLMAKLFTPPKSNT